MPDLILADVVMPEKNGYEVCEAIKANPATARIPVVLLSGTFEPFDRDRADRLGCDAIVSKPFDSQQLLRQVEALLARPAHEIPAAATMAIPVMTMAAPVPPPPPPPAAPLPPEKRDLRPRISPDPSACLPRWPAAPTCSRKSTGRSTSNRPSPPSRRRIPEFEYGDATEPGTGSVPGDVAPDPEPSRPEPAPAAEWLNEERESAAPPPPPAPAPFWVPRAPEPELAPIPFGADDSGVAARVRSRRRGPARRRSAHAADPARRGVRGARTHDGSAGRPRYGSDRAPAPRRTGRRRSILPRRVRSSPRRPRRPTTAGSRRRSRSWRRTPRSGS